jgi:hypothetical protein
MATKKKDSASRKTSSQKKATRQQKAEDRGDDVVASSGATYTESELAPLPPVGDLDVKDVKEVKGKGEFPPELTLESWVRLGKHDDVPERFVGHIAAVLVIPKKFDFDQNQWVQDFDKPVQVQTRDEAQSILYLPMAAFSEIAYTGGRPGLTSHA